jgi:tetratricopeptide (TPR) repeat protein
VESTEAVKELKSIKNLLYVIIISLLAVFFQTQLISLYINLTKVSSSSANSEVSFKNIAKTQSVWSVDLVKDTFDRGKLEIVIDMCNNRIEEYPNDAQPYWYRAKAFQMLGKNKEALLDLDKAEFIAPSWREKYTDPLRKEIYKQELQKRFEGTTPKNKEEIVEKLKEIQKDYKKE